MDVVATTPPTTNHALNCPFGDLVNLRHNEICNELGAIAAGIFQPIIAITIEPSLSTAPATTIPTGQHIHYDPPTAPIINPPAHTTTPAITANNTHDHGNIAIRGLFESETNAIIEDAKIANLLDSTSYRSQDPDKALLQQEKQKRQKYQATCETRRESFHPFLASTDGMMLAPEATKILQYLAHITAHRQQKPYSAIVNHLRLQIAITLVKAVHHCLRGSRKKRPQTTQTSTPNQPSSSEPSQPRLLHVIWLSNPADHS
jgi:hypothetical protein